MSNTFIPAWQRCGRCKRKLRAHCFALVKRADGGFRLRVVCKECVARSVVVRVRRKRQLSLFNDHT